MEKTIADRLYAAVQLPYDRNFKVDEAAYRRLLRYFLSEKRFVAQGGLVINPEAGEIYFLTREEKRRILEIAMEEAYRKLPIFAGTWANTTEEEIATAKDAKTLGVDGIFVAPPALMPELGSSWDADEYPEVWLDQIKAQDRAVDLPIITHPSGGTHAPFFPGLPLKATLQYCREVPNIVGWKMTYNYDGGLIICDALRSLGRHVAILVAHGSRFHEHKANDLFDGTLSGYWMYAMEPMLDHLEACDRGDMARAKQIWLGGLRNLQQYIDDRGRLHIRYKIGLWLRGLIPNPYMRPPMPAPRQQEIDTIYKLLQDVNLPVIGVDETRLAA
jgi:dihydrodipicolinate synthase/N-acetylneuraminate lyase